MTEEKRKPLLEAGGPKDAERPDVGPDPTVCYACDTFYAVDGRLLRFVCTAEDGHDGPHEQVTDGVLVFRWPDDPVRRRGPGEPHELARPPTLARAGGALAIAINGVAGFGRAVSCRVPLQL
ncbi:MAG: hypothetical protein ACLPY3_22820 [Solirubrobacteraceae bacterium]